eukprot:SAG22_NODE_2055_length_3069_cov_2.983502_4_plen_61_part_00
MDGAGGWASVLRVPGGGVQRELVANASGGVRQLVCGCWCVAACDAVIYKCNLQMSLAQCR